MAMLFSMLLLCAVGIPLTGHRPERRVGHLVVQDAVSSCVFSFVRRLGPVAFPLSGLCLGGSVGHHRCLGKWAVPLNVPLLRAVGLPLGPQA